MSSCQDELFEKRSGSDWLVTLRCPDGEVTVVTVFGAEDIDMAIDDALDVVAIDVVGLSRESMRGHEIIEVEEAK